MSSEADQDIQEFIEEALPILSECEDVLLKWENTPESNDIVDHIFRCFHSLKGISCLFDFEQVDTFIHKAESLLSLVRSERLAINADTISTFLKVIAALRVIIKNLGRRGDKDEDPEDYEILVAELRVKTLQKQAEGRLDAGTLPQTEELAFSAPITPTFIRLQARHLESILSLVEQLQTKQQVILSAFPSESQEEIAELIEQVKEKLNLIQKRPISEILDRLPNMVRKFALSQNKQIYLEIQGGETLITTSTLDMIADPIIHLIRNSMDHGIETVERRLQVGKPSEGHILLKVSQKARTLFLEISDDGQGIDPDEVLRVAVMKKLVTPKQAADLSLEQIYNLLLLPGFSTAKQVSRISGRGVGLNIVKSNVDKINGLLEFSSTVGREAKIRIIVPEID